MHGGKYASIKLTMMWLHCHWPWQIFHFSTDVNVFKYSDGAAALVLVSGRKASELGLHVIAKIRGYDDAAQVCKPVLCHDLVVRFVTWCCNMIGWAGT